MTALGWYFLVLDVVFGGVILWLLIAERIRFRRKRERRDT